MVPTSRPDVLYMYAEGYFPFWEFVLCLSIRSCTVVGGPGFMG